VAPFKLPSFSIPDEEKRHEKRILPLLSFFFSFGFQLAWGWSPVLPFLFFGNGRETESRGGSPSLFSLPPRVKDGDALSSPPFFFFFFPFINRGARSRERDTFGPLAPFSFLSRVPPPSALPPSPPLFSPHLHLKERKQILKEECYPFPLLFSLRRRSLNRDPSSLFFRNISKNTRLLFRH